jgi:hypothetical protein
MGLLKISSLSRIMKLFTRTLFPMALASLLAACGGTDPQDSNSFQTTTLSQVVVVPVGGSVANPAAATVVAANMPQPDCAADGCNRPRIIDGNAEAYRLDAMRRAEQGEPNPQS